MRAELTVTPDAATLPPPRSRERTGERIVDVEPALIGRILWRRRKWIVIVAALTVAAALAYVLLTPPQFTATAQLLVDPRDKQVVSNDVNPSTVAPDGGVTQVESQGAVLQSNGVLLRAIAATHLESDSEFNGAGWLNGVTQVLSLVGKTPDSGQMAERLKARTLETLRKRVTVKRADKVLVLDLSVRARTPDRAAEIVNAIADAYLVDQAEARSAAGRQASKSLTSRLDELQAAVAKAETEVEDYRASHEFVVSTGLLVSDQEINQTTAQLVAAQNRTSSLKSQLEQLRRNAGAEGTPEAMASGVMVRLRDRESAIVEKLANARRNLGPLHPDIAAMEQSLADVRGLIVKEVKRLRQAVEADYARAFDDERALKKKLDGMKTKSLDDGKADVRLRELQRQAEAARSIYQAFLVRAKETLEGSNVDTTNARIITRALPPLQKSWPPTILLVLGAATLGLSFGGGGALAHEYMRPSLLTLAQARDLIDAAPLGPVTQRELETGGKSVDALARMALRALAGVEAANGPAVGPCLYVASTPAAGPHRVRLAERIAALAARDGRQTLLIDADLGDGSSSERKGLIEMLGGDYAVTDLAYREKGERFARLARGAGDPYAHDPKGATDAFRLRRMRRAYDLVVLDAGAFSDNPRIGPLAAQATSTLLVAVLGEPQAELAREAETADGCGARFDAVALIDVGAV